MVDVPLVGRVAAGEPLLAVENIEDTVKVDRFFIGQTREVFALRVKGDSMIEDGIFDGDFIFVRKQLHANRGDIVVAMIERRGDGEALLPGRGQHPLPAGQQRHAADHRAQARLQEREPHRHRRRRLSQNARVTRDRGVDRGCPERRLKVPMLR